MIAAIVVGWPLMMITCILGCHISLQCMNIHCRLATDDDAHR